MNLGVALVRGRSCGMSGRRSIGQCGLFGGSQPISVVPSWYSSGGEEPDPDDEDRERWDEGGHVSEGAYRGGLDADLAENDG